VPSLSDPCDFPPYADPSRPDNANQIRPVLVTTRPSPIASHPTSPALAPRARSARVTTRLSPGLPRSTWQRAPHPANPRDFPMRARSARLTDQIHHRRAVPHPHDFPTHRQPFPFRLLALSPAPPSPRHPTPLALSVLATRQPPVSPSHPSRMTTPPEPRPRDPAQLRRLGCPISPLPTPSDYSGPPRSGPTLVDEPPPASPFLPESTTRHLITHGFSSDYPASAHPRTSPMTILALASLPTASQHDYPSFSDPAPPTFRAVPHRPTAYDYPAQLDPAPPCSTSQVVP
jgi:hypothetical protein